MGMFEIVLYGKSFLNSVMLNVALKDGSSKHGGSSGVRSLNCVVARYLEGNKTVLRHHSK